MWAYDCTINNKLANWNSKRNSSCAQIRNLWCCRQDWMEQRGRLMWASVMGLKIIMSDILLDSSLTCWGSDSKAGMQTGRIVYHIKRGRRNYGKKERPRWARHHPAAQSQRIKVAFLRTSALRQSTSSRKANLPGDSKCWHLLSINCNWCVAHSVTSGPPQPPPPTATTTCSAKMVCCSTPLTYLPPPIQFNFTRDQILSDIYRTMFALVCE